MSLPTLIAVQLSKTKVNPGEPVTLQAGLKVKDLNTPLASQPLTIKNLTTGEVLGTVNTDPAGNISFTFNAPQRGGTHTIEVSFQGGTVEPTLMTLWLQTVQPEFGGYDVIQEGVVVGRLPQGVGAQRATLKSWTQTTIRGFPVAGFKLFGAWYYYLSGGGSTIFPAVGNEVTFMLPDGVGWLFAHFVPA
jgi:hypothetical protein